MSALVTPGAQAHEPTAAEVRWARWAILVVFFVHGAAFATWVPLIPSVQQKLGLSAGTLGLALLGAALGSLATMPFTGGLIGRYGSRSAIAVAGLGYCAALLLPVLAPSFPLLFLALLIFGACQGCSDVAMNAHGVAVEKRYGRPILSSLHGLWSLGGLSGAAASGTLAAAGLSPLLRAGAAGLVLAVILALAVRVLLPRGVDAAPEGPAFARLTRPLLGLGILGICAYMAEGAIGDWSGVYLRRDLGADAGLAAAGYAAFTLTMTVGRLTGDRVTARLGPVAMVRLGGALLAVGLALALALDQTAAALVGFALIGCALANIVPIVFSAAGRTSHMAPGTAIAAVGTAIFLGYLVGPPLIGVTADHLTLRGGLGLVAGLGVVIVLLAPAVAHGASASSATQEAASAR